jgi:hypothetical protein
MILIFSTIWYTSIHLLSLIICRLHVIISIIDIYSTLVSMLSHCTGTTGMVRVHASKYIYHKSSNNLIHKLLDMHISHPDIYIHMYMVNKQAFFHHFMDICLVVGYNEYFYTTIYKRLVVYVV